MLLVKKAQEKKIWRGECSNVPKKSKSGVGKKKKLRTVRLRRKHVPTNVDHQQNFFKIGNPSGEPVSDQKKKKKKKMSAKNLVRGGVGGGLGDIKVVSHLTFFKLVKTAYQKVPKPPPTTPHTPENLFLPRNYP